MLNEFVWMNRMYTIRPQSVSRKVSKVEGHDLFGSAVYRDGQHVAIVRIRKGGNPCFE